MVELPFKQVTRENWLDPDPVNEFFVGTADEFLAVILAPQLDSVVPQEVAGLFEIARGTMSYGYLFYPFYTIAWEQLFRVGEAAIRHKYKAMQGPRSRKSMEEQIDWLIVHGALSTKKGQWWHWIRKGRNIVSHQEQQSLAPPRPAITHLEEVAARINNLFGQTPETVDHQGGHVYAVGGFARVVASHRFANRHDRVGRVIAVGADDYLLEECRAESQESYRYWINGLDLQPAAEEDCDIQIMLDVMKR